MSLNLNYHVSYVYMIECCQIKKKMYISSVVKLMYFRLMYTPLVSGVTMLCQTVPQYNYSIFYQKDCICLCYTKFQFVFDNEMTHNDCMSVQWNRWIYFYAAIVEQ